VLWALAAAPAAGERDAAARGDLSYRRRVGTVATPNITPDRVAGIGA